MENEPRWSILNLYHCSKNARNAYPFKTAPLVRRHPPLCGGERAVTGLVASGHLRVQLGIPIQHEFHMCGDSVACAASSDRRSLVMAAVVVADLWQGGGSRCDDDGGAGTTRRWETVAYFLHELLADDAEVLRESGAEHHDLLLRRRHLEDLLRVAAQIYKIQQLSGTIIVVNLH